MSAAISVVITCYNLERYVGAAIASVLAQDANEPVEIIVVDDCSLDNSVAVIESFSGVRCLSTEFNSGVLMAMLKGISHASSEFIFLLDGDDIWEPAKLSRCLQAFQQDETIALTTHDLSFVDQEGRPLPRTSRPGEVLNGLGPDAVSTKIIEGVLHLLDYIWLGSALGIRRSRADLEGFRQWVRTLPDPVNTYQDWPLAFWVLSRPGARAAYVPEKLFRYRLHGANHSGDARSASRALRNFRRSQNTLLAMEEVAKSQGLASSIQESLVGRRLAYDYLVDLYAGQRINAIAAFTRAIPDLVRRKQVGKELMRLISVLALGADRFARLSTWRHPKP